MSTIYTIPKMDVLNDAIKMFIIGVLDEASKRIAEKFDVSISEASSIWEGIDINLVNPVVAKSVKKQPVKKCKKVITDSENEDESNIEEGCVHVFLRGPRTGKVCNEKISGKSQTGTYCIKHVSHENKTQVKNKLNNDVSIPVKNITKYKITKNKFGNYTHALTGLVFKSAQEKVVYGIQDEYGEIHKLGDEDIETCKRLKFPIAKDDIKDASDYEENTDDNTPIK